MFTGPDGYSTDALFITRQTLRELESLPDSPEKTHWVAEFQQRENAWACVVWASNNLPKEDQRKADTLIASATPEQLVQFRAKIKQAQIAGGSKPTLLLKQLSDDSK